jgi:hemolysin D
MALVAIVALALLGGDLVRSHAAGAVELTSLAELASLLTGGYWPDPATARAGRSEGDTAELVLRLVLASPAGVVLGAIAALGLLANLVWRRALATARPPTGQVRMHAPQAAPASNPPLPGTLDREFLPAALEILVTPPSPKSSALLLAICGAFLAALAWSYFGWIDIHAVAAGKIQPSGRSKIVQPLEAGKVVAIHVENGASVVAGDLLLELDPTETGADREALARDLESASAEAARRNVAIAIASSRADAARPVPIVFDAGVGEAVRRREQNVLAADLAQLRSTIASLNAQLAEKQASRQRLKSSIDARQRLIALAKERVDMRSEIETRGSGSRAMIIESLQQYESFVTTDVGERGQVIEIEAALNSLERKIEEAVTQFVADQTQKLAEIERKRDRLVQEHVKARSKNDRTQLRAPISGSVQQMSVTTVGQVVAGGQSLLTVVPLDGPIEVEAMITNKDIGFVEAGQPAVVKVEAFPFTRYGTIEATVAKVSRDAVDDRSAAGLTDVASVTRPQRASPSPVPQVSNLVFPATIRLGQRAISVDGKQVALLPGMAVTVEIKTGQRRAIDFLMSPLREVAAGAARER